MNDQQLLNQLRARVKVLDQDLIISILEQRELISNGLPEFVLNYTINDLLTIFELLKWNPVVL